MTRSSLIIGVLALVFGVRVVATARARRLPEQHSLLWLAVVAVVLLFAVWREGIDLVAEVLGIHQPPLVILLGACAGLLWLVYRQSMELAEQRQQLRALISEVALLRASGPDRGER